LSATGVVMLRHDFPAPPLIFALKLVIASVTAALHVRILQALLARWPKAAAAAAGGLMGVYLLLCIYHFKMLTQLGLLLIVDNWGEMFDAAAKRMLSSVAGASTYVLLGVAAAAVGVFVLKTTWLDPPERPRPRVFLGMLVAFVVVATAGLRLNGDYVYRFYGEFTAAAFREKAAAFADTGTGHPLIRRLTARNAQVVVGERPDVIVVLVESFGGYYTGRVARDGKPFTPVFDALARESLSVKHMYGNSTQTERGHVATLCSILPRYYHKIMKYHAQDTEFACLPRVLKEHGYRTYWFQGQPDLGFDNTGPFMERIAFDVVTSMAGRFEPTPENSWGWGPPDDLTYRTFFAAIDADAAKRPAGEPYFAVLPTISNHLPYSEAPQRYRTIHPVPTNYWEHYENSIRMTDGYLATFLEAMRAHPRWKNAVLVVSGDHGPPINASGEGLTTAYQERSLRVPLAVHWAGRLAPRRLDAFAHSQLDIAPTILDLLGLDVEMHTLGKSLLDAERNERFAIVNPLQGINFIAIEWPYKFVQRYASGEELLFDLSRDPEELASIPVEERDPAVVARLKEQLAFIDYNEALIRSDRLWPAGRSTMIRQD